MKFTVDRSRWINGRYGVYDYGKVGATSLCNRKGFKCCLGFVCEQSGVEIYEMVGVSMPSELESYSKVSFLAKAKHVDTELAENAQTINDDDTISDSKREYRLTVLFEKHGHQLEFVGEYPELE